MTPSGDSEASAGRPRQVTDKQIFQALAEAITEVGPTNWTLDDVGARLRITGPALGYRFGNKRGLLVAFAAHQPGATADRFDEAAASKAPLDAMYDALTGTLEHMDTRAKVANNVAMLSIDLADDELAAYAKAQARVIKEQICHLLVAAGVASAEHAPDLAHRIYIVWSGAVLAWAIDGRGPLDTWVRGHIADLIDEPSEPQSRS